MNYNELTCIVDNDGNSELIKQLQNPTEIDIRKSFKKLLFDCFNTLKINEMKYFKIENLNVIQKLLCFLEFQVDLIIQNCPFL